MANLANTTAFPVRLNICGSSTIEVHHWHTSRIGRQYVWEQQYFLDFLGVADRRSYRKTQVQRQYLERTIARWSCMSCDFSHGSTDGDSIRQTNLSTQALISWVFDAHRQFATAHSGNLEQFGVVFRELTDASVIGAALLTARPSISAMGAELAVSARGTVPVRLLLGVYPTLPAEWEQIRTSAQTCALRAWPADGEPLLGDLLAFLEARCYYSGRLTLDHILVGWRNAAAAVMAFLVEVRVNTFLNTFVAQSTLEPTVLYAPGGKRRSRRGIVTRTRWIDRMRHIYGTDNAIMNALADGHCGYASIVHNVSNRLYRDQARDSFVAARRCAFFHDEANYSGWHVNIGLAVDVLNERGVYLKPQAGRDHWDLKMKKWSSRLRGCENS